jgi:hypothetical protein
VPVHTSHSVCTYMSPQSQTESHTVNEGPVRIQYKCLVLIYVFPEMKLCGLVISKTELMFYLPISTFM